MPKKKAKKASRDRGGRFNQAIAQLEQRVGEQRQAVDALVAQRSALRAREAAARLALRQLAELLRLGALVQEQRQRQHLGRQHPLPLWEQQLGSGAGGGPGDGRAPAPAPEAPDAWHAQLLELQSDLDSVSAPGYSLLSGSGGCSSGPGGGPGGRGVGGGEEAGASASGASSSAGGGPSGSGGGGGCLDDVPAAFSAAPAAARATALIAEGGLTADGFRRTALAFTRTSALLLGWVRAGGAGVRRWELGACLEASRAGLSRGWPRAAPPPPYMHLAGGWRVAQSLRQPWSSWRQQRCVLARAC
jgi:hypothetical protein